MQGHGLGLTVGWPSQCSLSLARASAHWCAPRVALARRQHAWQRKASAASCHAVYVACKMRAGDRTSLMAHESASVAAAECRKSGAHACQPRLPVQVARELRRGHVRNDVACFGLRRFAIFPVETTHRAVTLEHLLHTTRRLQGASCVSLTSQHLKHFTTASQSRRSLLSGLRGAMCCHAQR
jgi:hypothetical protein